MQTIDIEGCDSLVFHSCRGKYDVERELFEVYPSRPAARKNDLKELAFSEPYG